MLFLGKNIQNLFSGKEDMHQRKLIKQRMESLKKLQTKWDAQMPATVIEQYIV